MKKGVETALERKAYLWVFALASPCVKLSTRFSSFGMISSWPIFHLRLSGSASKKKDAMDEPLRVPTEKSFRSSNSCMLEKGKVALVTERKEISLAE